MLAQIRPAIVSTVLLTLVLGVGYPLAVTGIGGLAFPNQAQGSLVRNAAGAVVGSSLIAQGFAQARYLQPRASAAGKGYDAAGSSGSNLGPLSGDLIAREKEGAAAYRTATGQRDVPADAVTTSGSGLDPDVSPANAALQVKRIADARGVTSSQVERVIAAHTTGRALGFLGQPRVNVLEVNLGLDAALPVHTAAP
jgi:K+-transporting ATPase ATPase C chain